MHGPDFLTVLRQDFAVTAYQYLLLHEREAAEAKVDRLLGLQDAQRMAVAVHDSKRLWSEERMARNALMANQRALDFDALVREAKALEQRLRTKPSRDVDVTELWS